MTIALANSTPVEYQGNGSGLIFNYPWKIFAATDLVVGFIVGGTYTIQSSSTYTVSQIGVNGGGQVTFLTAPPAGTTIDLRTQTPETQPTEFANLGAYLPENTTNAADRLTRALQDCYRQTYTYGIHGPDSELTPWTALPGASVRANSMLIFDGNGLPEVGIPTTQALTSSLLASLLPSALTTSILAPFITTPLIAPLVNLGQTANEVIAGVTPTYLQYPEGNVLRYGADATGVVASDASFKSAILVCCTGASASGYGNHATFVVPKGYYQLTTTNVFGNPLVGSYGAIRGMKFSGAGSLIQLNTQAGIKTLWLFDGTSTEGPTGSNPTVQNWLDCTFEDFCFIGDVAVVAGVNSTANGFRGYTTAGLKFSRISINSFNVGYDSESQAAYLGYGGDSWYFSQCYEVNMSGAVIQLNNSQAVNWTRSECRSETLYGDCVRVNQGGGGAFRWYGGSIITQGGTAQTYLLNLNISIGAGIGDNNNTFLFSGIQTEAHSAQSCLVYSGEVGAQAPNITFHKCNFTETGGSRTSVDIIEAHVFFDNCVMTENQGSGYNVAGPAAGGDQYGDPGSIIFQNCEVPINLSTYCTTPTNADGLSWGYISARQCWWSNFDSGVPRTTRTAIDFDMNWQNQGRAGTGEPRLKEVSGYVQNRQMPDSTSSFNWTVNLPVGATIVKLLAYRPATTGATAYTLLIGNSSNASLYGTSGASTTGAAQTVSVDWTATPASWVTVGSTSPGNQVQLSATTTATGATAAGSGGYFKVWYY
jgi:hypothetical protein